MSARDRPTGSTVNFEVIQLFAGGLSESVEQQNGPSGKGRWDPFMLEPQGRVAGTSDESEKMRSLTGRVATQLPDEQRGTGCSRFSFRETIEGFQ